MAAYVTAGFGGCVVVKFVIYCASFQTEGPVSLVFQIDHSLETIWLHCDRDQSTRFAVMVTTPGISLSLGHSQTWSLEDREKQPPKL